jgi:subtilisin family serine protease
MITLSEGSMRHSRPLSVFLLCLLAAASAGAVSFVSAADAPNATPGLLRELNRGVEEVRVIIGVRDGTPSARRLLASPDPEGEPERRVLRVGAQKRLAEEMTPRQFAVKHYYESFSMLAGTATREAVLTLANHPDVAWVELDKQAHLLQRTPQSSQLLIHSDQANSLGITGAGQAIAVIDTGVDYTIADLGGGSFPNAKVIGGTDITDKDSDPMDCEGHGTEVAGVAAGSRGVAPDAKIVAIKVFSSANTSNSSCKDTAEFSDIIAGINYAITNKATFGISVINLSLGGAFEDSLDHGYCDADADADTKGSAVAVDAATAAGIVVVAAAGNDAITNQLSVPACVSSAVSVGAVYADNRTQLSWCGDDACTTTLCTDQPVVPDGIVCFSNSTSNLSLLGPGAFWSVATKGGSQDSFSGTSASTPAVAGAVALLRQARPDLTPAGVIGVLRSTGKPITDARNGVVTPRVDILAAVRLAASSFAVSSAPAVDIPDGSGSATATATISGFTRPVAAVQAWVEINHPEPEQLRLTLIGPDGTSALLQDLTGMSQHPINAIFGRGEFAGRQANGVWTLRVEDLVSGPTGLPGELFQIKFFAVTLIPLAERPAVTRRSSSSRTPRTLNPRH